MMGEKSAMFGKPAITLHYCVKTASGPRQVCLSPMSEQIVPVARGTLQTTVWIYREATASDDAKATRL